MPWLWTFAVFTIIRFMAFLFFSIVNDLIFAYNILMVLLWIVLLLGCAYSWLIIYSLYLELSDLTKLEDLAHLRVSEVVCYFVSLTDYLWAVFEHLIIVHRDSVSFKTTPYQIFSLKCCLLLLAICYWLVGQSFFRR